MASFGWNENSTIKSSYRQFRISNDGYRWMWQGMSCWAIYSWLGYFWRKSYFIQSLSMLNYFLNFLQRIFEIGSSQMEVSVKQAYHGHGVVQKQLVIEFIIQQRFQFWIQRITLQLNQQCLPLFILSRKLLKERFINPVILNLVFESQSLDHS